MVDHIGKFLHRLFEEYKFVRRSSFLLVFGMWAWATSIVFTSLDQVTTPVAAAYGTLTGVIATMFGFYQWSRDKDAD